MRKKGYFMRKLVILVLTLGILFIWSATSWSQTVKIGAILPFTGTGAAYGKWQRQGSDMAVEEINEMGGVKGKKLEIAYEDTKSVPKDAVAGVNKLFFVDKIPVIMTTLTGVTKALIPIAEKNGFILTTSATMPGITEGTKWVFRNATNMYSEQKTLVAFAAKRYKKVALVTMNTEIGQWTANFFKRNFEDLGGKIVANETFEQGGTDFRVQLFRVKAVDPEALYIYGYKELAICIKQAREMGIKAQFLGNLDFELPEVLTIGKEAAEGAIYTKAAFDPGSPDKIMRDYQAKYKAKYGELSEAYAAYHYDMVKLICKAVESGGYSAEGIRKELLKIKNYPGVSGETTFLPNGDVDKPIVLKTIRGGKYIPYSE